MVGIIGPVVGIGLNDVPKSGGGRVAPLPHPPPGPAKHTYSSARRRAVMCYGHTAIKLHIKNFYLPNNRSVTDKLT